MKSGEILAELWMACKVFIYGVPIPFGYDLLRIFRRAFIHNNAWIGMEDACFWIGTTYWIFLVLYRTNDGELRLYVMAAMVLGMVMYLQTISDPFVKLAGKGCRWLVCQGKHFFAGIKFSILKLGNKLKNRWKPRIMKDRQKGQ